MTRLRILFDTSELPSLAEASAKRDRAYRPPRESRTLPVQAVAAIALEMPGVLFDDSLWPRWLWTLLGRLGLKTSFDLFWRIFELEYLPSVYSAERDLWSALAAYLSEMGFSRGRIEEVRIAAEKRRQQWELELRPLPGVVATLGQLAEQGVPLVVLTNSCCSAEHLRERLAILGIERHFADVISSQCLRRALPHESAWASLVDRLGCRPAEIAFLSRHPHIVAGAAAAGLFAISIHGAHPPGGGCHLDQFAELTRFVAPRRQQAA